jgi:two-component system, chemotaxis family, CheB/CheR fusion protein
VDADTGTAFLTIGVGASAGGLDAIQRFLRHMPPGGHLALVYVPHLDPSHESVLPELLARAALVPVQVVQDGTIVEPDHVYVIPPNASLAIHGGVLRLGTRLSATDAGKPIDHFLISLAEDQGARAGGVILSGTGTDGTAGLRAIKDRGGVTLGQRPESAAYDSMPRSAIAAGLADDVLAPEEMPARLFEHAARVLAADVPSPIDEVLAGICDLLHRRVGHDFSGYKPSTLVRRIGRRMEAVHIAQPREYLLRLEQDAGEAPLLLQEILIGVTAFFRDREAFDALAQVVVPGLLDGKSQQDRVRLWVVGCATGEEVYSLAILMAEEAARVVTRGGTPPKAQIFATDIDDEALQVARQGRYPESACSLISPDRLERFFVIDEGSYRVCQSLRQLCVFSKHNVLHDPPLTNLDLISCRNLLIYIDARVQPDVIRLFHHALRAGGVLLLGAAETAVAGHDLFEPIESAHRAYRRRELPTRSPVQFPISRGDPNLAALVTAPTRGELEGALRRTVERAVLEEFAPAGLVVRDDGEIEYVFGSAAKYLGPSAGAPSLNALSLVRKSLRSHLRRALQTASRRRDPVVAECPLGTDAVGPAQWVRLLVRRFPEAGQNRNLYVVVFEEVHAREAPEVETLPRGEDQAVQDLRVELRDTSDRLQATIDALETSNQELQSANEELLSMNEELQSANEELQSSKEEVQTVNGELETVNRELVSRVDELDTARSDLESLFEGAQVATVFLDRGLLIRRFTPTATEVFRLRAGDVGRPVTDITARFANGDVATEIRDVLRTLQRKEVTVTRADDGSSYLMRILPYRTRKDVIDGVVLTFVDVTALKRAQEAAERADVNLERRVDERTADLVAADRRKDDFLAMLAHELRNPLAVIASGMHLWRSQPVDDPVLIRARDLALRQVDHMTHLLDDLLDTARIVRGAVELRRAPLNLAAVLRDVVDANPAPPDRLMHVSLSLPTAPIPIDGDRDRLQQVFGNLLTNAQKFTNAGGHVEVSATVAGDKVVVRVADDGVGMSSELLPHVFAAFVQGRRGAERKQGGLGLGLTVVRELVGLHGGSVQGRSAGEGRGSEFLVTLPLGQAAPTAPPAVAAPARNDAGALASKRVLVVDDNLDAAEMLALALRMEGHEVVTASDGPTALAVAAERRPDVVLLDIGLPGVDGYEVARRFRQDPAFARVTLVAVTGYGREQDRERSREVGFDHHMVKPVDPAALLRLVRAVEPTPGA